MTEETYAKIVDEFYEDELKDRFIAHLNRVADELGKQGFTCSQPYDITDGSYSWDMAVTRDDIPEAVDIAIDFAESLEYEGTTEGVNISLRVVGEGGRIIGDLTPYNYSSEVWVPLEDWEEINRRMQMHEHSDVQNIGRLIEQAYG